MYKNNRIRGIVLPIVIVIIFVLIILLVAINSIGFHNIQVAKTSRTNDQALYAAEAGLELAMSRINANRAWDGKIGEELEFRQVPLHSEMNYDGVFTVWVWNNIMGSSESTGPPSVEMEEILEELFPDLESLPSGSAYVLVKGESGKRTDDGKETFSSRKYVGTMIKESKTSLYKYAIFGDDGLKLGNINVFAYDSNTGEVFDQDALVLNPNAPVADIGTNAEAWEKEGDTVVTGAGNTYFSGDLCIYDEYYDKDGITDSHITKTVQPADYMDMPAVDVPLLPEGSVEADKKNKTYYYSSGYSYGSLNHQTGTVILQVTESSRDFVFDKINVGGNAEVYIYEYYDDGSGIKEKRMLQSPVNIYVKGDITLTGGVSFGIPDASEDEKINPAEIDPSLVRIYCSGEITDNKGNVSVSIQGNPDGAFVLYAPTADVTISGKYAIYGAIIGKTITNHGNPAAVMFDIKLIG
jgi:hypothetical protein